MKHSAGLAMFRRSEDGLEVFLVHPGGPFFRRKDEGAWSIPKGLIEGSEDPLMTARREFEEETGVSTPPPKHEERYIALGEIQQKGGKTVRAWAFEGDCDPDAVTSNTFELEWPPRSGRIQTFPEIDRAAFFPFSEARRKINPAQVALIERLEEILK
jgi:predicted NUDIX family NTP pyrophosphohydrolase